MENKSEIILYKTEVRHAPDCELAEKLCKEYTGTLPQLIEGDIFKIIVAIPPKTEGAAKGLKSLDTASDTVNDTVSDTVNEGLKAPDTVSDTVNDTVNDTVSDTVKDTVKSRLVQIILLIKDKPGIKKQKLADNLKVSEVTIKRDMQKIKELVIFIGPQKTGGYYHTEKMKKILEGNK